MIWHKLLKTVLLCGISILIEAISATKEGKRWLENLKRPRFSFSFKVCYFVGAVYYLIFGIVAYRQFAIGMNFFSTSIVLLASMMLINGLSNFVAFKYRSLKWFYLIIYPFAVLLLLALIIMLWKVDDKLSAMLASLYFLWLFFDLYRAYNLWRLDNIENRYKDFCPFNLKIDPFILKGFFVFPRYQSCEGVSTKSLIDNTFQQD